MTEQTIQPKDDRLLTEREVADRWGVSREIVKQMRIAGKGPAFIPVGNSPRYKITEIERFEGGGLLTMQNVAARWGVTVRNIQQRQEQGRMPDPVMLGARKRYRLNDLVALEKEQTRSGGRMSNPMTNQ